MKYLANSGAGLFAIVALVASGVWFARDAEERHRPAADFSDGSTANGGRGDVTFYRLNFSADGQKMLLMFWDQNDARRRLALQDLTQVTPSLEFDAMGDTASACALGPDGRHVLIGSHEGRLWWLDSESLDVSRPLVESPAGRNFSAVTVSGDGRIVAGGNGTGSIYVCDLLCPTTFILLADGQSSVSDLCFSHDGKLLICAQYNGCVSAWDFRTATLLREFKGHCQPVKAAKLLPDGRRIISASMDGTVRMWDLAGGWELWRGETGLSGVLSLAVSPDGTTAACGGFDRRIVVWDLERRQKKFEIAVPPSVVFHLTFSPDGSMLAAAGSQGTFCLFDAQTGADLDLPITFHSQAPR